MVLLVAGCISEPAPWSSETTNDDARKTDQHSADGPAETFRPLPDGKAEHTSVDVPDASGEAKPGPDTVDAADMPDAVDAHEIPDSVSPDVADAADMTDGADLTDLVEEDSDVPPSPEVDSQCNPDCEGKECGGDGCGGSCGDCIGGKLCNVSDHCVCPSGQADCAETCCNEGEQCHVDTGACCVSDCTDKECGDDGCGNSCGQCPGGGQAQCQDGSCICLPDCTAKDCGDDGCEGSCGLCDPGLVCSQGKCAPFAEWAVNFENSGGYGSGISVAADGQGNSVIGGWFGWADVVLAGTTLHPMALQEVMVAKVDSTGNALWAKSFSGDQEDAALLVELDGQGSVYLAGGFTSTTIDLGGGPLPNAGTQTNDLFILKLDSSGDHVWAKAYGGDKEDGIRAMAVDPAGNVFIAGMFMSASVVFGDFTLVNATGDVGLHDVFVVKLNPDGGVEWATSFPASGAEDCGGLALDEDGYIYLTGGFSSDDFALLDNPLPHIGSFDIFVAALNSSGTPVWAKSFGGSGDEIGTGLEVDSLGHVVSTAMLFGQAIDFGAGPLPILGGTDVVAFQLDKFGNFVWANLYGGKKDDSPTALALDGEDHIYVLGVSSSSTPDFGAGDLPTAGGQDGFLMKLESSGATVWTETWGSTANELVFGICSATDGGLFVTGEFWGPSFDLGGAVMQNTTHPDLLTDDGGPTFYLVKLAQ